MSNPQQFLSGRGQTHTYSLPSICVVGEQLMEGVNEWPEGSIFDYTDRGCQLLLSYRHPAEQEIEMFSDTVRLALFCKYNVIFLLFKLGNMPWQDAPYSYWLVPEAGRADPEADLRRPGDRLFLHCFLVNAATGVLENMRAVTFSPRFTTQLLESIKAQSLIPTTQEQHSASIAQIYRQYPTPKAMVKDSLVQCKGGD